jgi:hypothetical protein
MTFSHQSLIVVKSNNALLFFVYLDQISVGKSFLASLTSSSVNMAGCREFVTDLCLEGDFIMYTHSEDQEHASGELRLCDQVNQTNSKKA